MLTTNEKGDCDLIAITQNTVIFVKFDEDLNIIV